MMNSKISIFTIVARNYFHFAKTLINSIKKQHDDIDYFIVLVDGKKGIDIDNGEVTIVDSQNLSINQYEQMSFYYDVTEFSTAIKPFAIEYLFSKGYRQVIYFDPDIFVYNSLDVIFEELEKKSIVLTPHITKPVSDKLLPDEATYLKAGTYNLGFIALSNTDSAHEFVDWWKLKCIDECFNEVETGLFVDQKWINLVPGLFDDVKVIRHLGCNMAYWNLHERKIGKHLLVNELQPLIFFHFSGLVVDDLDCISKYQNRYTLKYRDDLKQLFEDYRQALVDNGYSCYKDLKYLYNYYEDNVFIGNFSRKLYYHVQNDFPNPFVVKNNCYRDLIKKHHLLEKSAQPTLIKGKISGKAKIINKVLKLILLIIGVDRYVALMRYMRYISNLRRQKFLLGLKMNFSDDGRKHLK